MARNRQRAKQRQAERRARRLEGKPAEPAQPRAVEPTVEDPRVAEPSPAIDPGLAVGAPPQELGRSDEALEEGVAAEDELAEDEALAEEAEAAEDYGDGAEPVPAEYAPRGRRGREAVAEAKERPRFVQFLIHVWAELQRVQWPNRQALVTLTGVVLGFVLIAGGYLGLLDAIFSRIIQAIL